MSKSLYITSAEPKSGKSLISLGIMELLKSTVSKVAFFRPSVSNTESDPDIELIMKNYNLQMDYKDTYGISLEEALKLMSEDRKADLIDIILSKFRKLEENFDFILIEGSDFKSASRAFELEINSEIAKNLGAPVIAVCPATDKDEKETAAAAKLAVESYSSSGCTVIGLFITRSEKERIPTLKKLVSADTDPSILTYYIPENDILRTLTMNEIRSELDAEILFGHEYLFRHAHHTLVAAMRLENFLSHLKEGTLVIVPGDRADIILGGFVCSENKNFPRIMGIILTGGIYPDPSIRKIMDGIDAHIPVLLTKEDTLRTVDRISRIDSKISPNDKIKIAACHALFESSTERIRLKEKIIIHRSTVVTPKMFEYDLIQKAKSSHRHIVLPEGSEERILRAAEVLLHREVAKITLLGNEAQIRDKIKKLGLKVGGAEIIDPAASPLFKEYCDTYFELRKHKGITPDNARDVMSDASYFGTMMVYKGHADGMVSGSVNTTQHTIRPALEFVKTKPGCSLVSSVFLMCLPDRVLVYGDCAVNPNPSAKELAEIAISSAETASKFGIEPRVAMLSYSTGESGKGEDVEKVREAVKIAREKYPSLLIEGPIQYDAAVDPDVAKTKMPDSPVAGQATVFIFPDLNTGNNTYKAVQRSANAVAVGPVLQGLNKPVNDLSRGCTIPDIINTVAITAIQAGD
ncbi:MAG TPA: phosphate acetyltransferase [Leptospiraceae bacterium]|nr:phosphate acetyltransferase [Leptospiraceae bacterium]